MGELVALVIIFLLVLGAVGSAWRICGPVRRGAGMDLEATEPSKSFVISTSPGSREYEAKGDMRGTSKGRKWICALDESTCETCQGYSGKIWDFEDNPIDHDTSFPGRPPLHPGCRCILLPLPKSWEELAAPGKRHIARKMDEAARAAEKNATQSSEFGPIPANWDYARFKEWVDAGRPETEEWFTPYIIQMRVPCHFDKARYQEWLSAGRPQTEEWGFNPRIISQYRR